MSKKETEIHKQPISNHSVPEETVNGKTTEHPSGVSVVHQESYQGPIPPPAMLEQYKRIYTQAPEIILREFEENSKHIRQREILEIQGNIDRDKRGQWMAFVICIAVLLIVLYSLYLGNITFAGLSGLGFIALMVKGFFKR